MFGPEHLHEYQQRMIDRIFNYDSTILVACMGSGKTVTSATAAKELLEEGDVKAVWIIAPKRVAIDVWGKELQNWSHLKDVSVSMVVGTPAQRLAAIKRKADFYVTNYDNLQWLETVIGRFGPDTMVIFDELTRLKNPQGKRAKAARRMVERTRHRLGMTGTPKPKNHQDYFMQQLLVRGPKLWGTNFYQWRAKYFIAHDPDQHQWEPRAGVGSYLDDQYARQCFIITDTEIGKAYVEPVMRYHLLDIPKAAMVAHDKALRNWILELPGKGKSLLANSAVGSGKARQIASGYAYDDEHKAYRVHDVKLDHLKDMVEDIGEPVMICYEFLPELDAICEAFPGIRVIGDGAKDAEISETVELWNKGQLPVIAIHPNSAGHGLNLQHGGRHMIWFTLPWGLEAYRQTLRRLARQGQKKTVFIHHLIAVGTVEEQLVLPRLQGRADAEDAFKALVAELQSAR